MNDTDTKLIIRLLAAMLPARDFKTIRELREDVAKRCEPNARGFELQRDVARQELGVALVEKDKLGARLQIALGEIERLKRWGHSIGSGEIDSRLKQDRDKGREALDLAMTALKDCYLKHHVGDPDIGWDQLSYKIHTVLTEIMGDDKFEAWMAPHRERICR